MTDGYLPGAREQLRLAVAALCEPIGYHIDGKTLFTGSWYRQLQDSLPGAPGLGGGAGTPLVGCWLDALDLLNEIDDDVQRWQTAVYVDIHRTYNGVTTPDRLALLEARRWRPQDCRQLTDLTGIVNAWTNQIQELLTNPRRWTLPNPCPDCKTAVTYRRDSGGEAVRQPALHLTVDACTCMHCHAVWRPSQFALLAKVLDGNTPGR